MSTAIDIPPQFEIVDRPLDTQMTISMGPQHPSTHGVLRLELVLDGEMVVKSTPDIGYLHTGMEKLFEYRKYQQGIVITDRMDYLNPLGNNLAYVMAVEKLLQIEIPAGFEKRVQQFQDTFPKALDEFDKLVTGNRIFQKRTQGIGYISAEDAIDWGLSGPSLRGSGVALDLRRANPYTGYEKYDFETVIDPDG